jgi:hypothetical protein
MCERFFCMPQMYHMGWKMHYGFLLIYARFEPMNLLSGPFQAPFNGIHIDDDDDDDDMHCEVYS